MKKTAAIVLAAMTAVTLTSCGSKNRGTLDTINICGEEFTIPFNVDDLESKFTTEPNDYGQLDLSLNGKKIGTADYNRDNSKVIAIYVYSNDQDQISFDGIDLGTKAKSQIKKKYGKPYIKADTALAYDFENDQQLLFTFNDNKELESVVYYNFNLY